MAPRLPIGPDSTPSSAPRNTPSSKMGASNTLMVVPAHTAIPPVTGRESEAKGAASPTVSTAACGCCLVSYASPCSNVSIPGPMRTDEGAKRRPHSNVIKRGYSHDPIFLRTAVRLRGQHKKARHPGHRPGVHGLAIAPGQISYVTRAEWLPACVGMTRKRTDLSSCHRPQCRESNRRGVSPEH